MTLSRLTLQVVSRQSADMECPSAQPDGLPFTIGRKPGNSWVLPDPDRHVSKCHCIVERDGPDWILTDTSTNGVYINNGSKPLGNRNSAVLQDGDLLRLGTYDVVVSITAIPAAIPAQPPAIPPQPDPFEDALPFGGGAPVAEPPPRWSQPDHAPPETSSFRMPDPVAGAAMSASSFIPPDWDMDEDAARPPPPAAPAVEPPRPAPPIPGQVPPALPGGAPGAEGDPLWTAFLDGLGLDLGPMSPAERAATIRTVAMVYRTGVLGLMQLLRSRATVKATFNVDHTMIQAVDNNPLKFVPDPDEALTRMVRPTGRGYMPPDDAMRQALDDLRAHEMAMMAAVQKAVTALVKEFDPEAVARAAESGGGITHLLPGARKAQCWDHYERHYKRVLAGLEEDLLGAFGRAFGRAYLTHTRTSERR
ncbi:type VI secretion system-associated FHA domain protein TagH [Azospirillum rugosum]|uniref:Type VI secretion system FHA domain protein n=1 Tax=Azospirillum rugosum TaxID=416170 RepID=A0ABS4SKY3_9PROT|nr:type VI secretion system-associated FHA domain protein TagH [Azospirillum rugosum]MBP2293220.1 type VI secretion system FHA domain protein [Azospirillum rugosum]